MSLPLVEKYRPKTKTDLIGNEVAINGLILFLKRWTPRKAPMASLLLGPAGSGKTSSVYAIAKDLGYTIMEVNASDSRNKQSIKDILEPATRFSELESDTNKKIILMEEVDGLSGTHDRGGLSEFFTIIKNTNYPIICTANDPESQNIIKIMRRKEFRTYNYERLDEFQIFELILNIAELENITIDEDQIEILAETVSGDLRAAINELESHKVGTNSVKIEERNKMKPLLSILNELYRSKNYENAKKVFSNAPSDYYKILLYIFDQTYRQCHTPEEISTAYDQIANADLYYNRIMKNQNWSLLKYFFEFIGPGIQLSRPSKTYKKINSLPNIPTAFMARGKAKNVKSKAIKLAPSIAPKIHISKNRFINQEYPLIEKILLGINGADVAAWLNLNDDEIEIISKGKSKSSLIENIESSRKKIGLFNIKSGKKDYNPTSMLDELAYEENNIEQKKEIIDEEQNENQSSLEDYF